MSKERREQQHESSWPPGPAPEVLPSPAPTETIADHTGAADQSSFISLGLEKSVRHRQRGDQSAPTEGQTPARLCPGSVRASAPEMHKPSPPVIAACEILQF